MCEFLCSCDCTINPRYEHTDVADLASLFKYIKVFTFIFIFIFIFTFTFTCIYLASAVITATCKQGGLQTKQQWEQLRTEKCDNPQSQISQGNVWISVPHL